MSGKRTPEQQTAYNEKRRQESAAKKAPVKRPTVVIETTAAHIDKIKRMAKKAEREAAAEEKALVKKKVKPVPKKFAGKTKSAKPIKGVDDVGTYTMPGRVMTKKITVKRKPRIDIAEQVKKLGADSLLPPSKKEVRKLIVSQPTPAPAVVDKTQLTNSRSYQKKFAGMGATMRGNMAQVTITFTVEQFNTIKSAAEFRGCSIAETIRHSVLREHGSALNQ